MPHGISPLGYVPLIGSGAVDDPVGHADESIECVGLERLAQTLVPGLREPLVEQLLQALIDERHLALGAGGVQVLRAVRIAPAPHPSALVDPPLDLLEVLLLRLLVGAPLAQ